MKKGYKLSVILIIILVFACKETNKTSALDFKLIPRNSYFIDNYNGISVYRDNETKKVMDGYFVVGNELTKWEEFELTNGVLNGDCIVFHNNGKIFSHATYLNGKLHGEEKTYKLTGALSKISHFKHGVRYGKDITYFDNGQIKSESTINDNEVVESVTYNSIGEIETQMFIRDSRKITQTIKAGRVFSEHIESTYDDFEATKFYNEDGSLKMFLAFRVEDDKGYIIEFDEDENEIKSIDVTDKPEEAYRYQEYFTIFK